MFMFMSGGGGGGGVVDGVGWGGGGGGGGGGGAVGWLGWGGVGLWVGYCWLPIAVGGGDRVGISINTIFPSRHVCHRQAVDLNADCRPFLDVQSFRHRDILAFYNR